MTYFKTSLLFKIHFWIMNCWMLLIGAMLTVGVSANSVQDNTVKKNIDAHQKCVFGVVPQQSASKLARLWRPILNHLETKTGIQFVFATAKTIPIFEQRLAKGDYDLAYMNPYHYTVFHESPGYEAIAKQKNKRIKGIVVVRRDSDLNDLAELSGQTLAFPAPAAFAASVLPRAHFKKMNIAVTPKYVSSHDSVYLSVVNGVYPAGGGVMRTFKNMDFNIQEKLRVLWETETFTPHAIAIHPRVKRHQDRLQAALLSLNETEQSQALLKALNFKGMAAASNQDWDDVRALGIPLLNELINH